MSLRAYITLVLGLKGSSRDKVNQRSERAFTRHRGRGDRGHRSDPVRPWDRHPRRTPPALASPTGHPYVDLEPRHGTAPGRGPKATRRAPHADVPSAQADPDTSP